MKGFVAIVTQQLLPIINQRYCLSVKLKNAYVQFACNLVGGFLDIQTGADGVILKSFPRFNQSEGFL